MANSTTSRIRIVFDGVAQGLNRAAAQVERAVRRVETAVDRANRPMQAAEKSLIGLAKGFALFGGLSAGLQSTVSVLAALASITAQLAPATLALPGIVLGLGVAYGTAKLALSGFTDAVKGDAEALARFGSAGQAAVQAVRGLEGEFTKLRRSVSEAFFDGLAKPIARVGDALLRLAQRELPAVATGFRNMAKEALGVLAGDLFSNDLTTIIRNTAKALDNMRFTLASVISGFVGLGAVGSKYLPRLGAAIDNVAARFSQWVDKGIETRSIERMIDRAIVGFQSLGRILRDVGAGARSLFSAFSDGLAGPGGALGAIERVAAAFRELASSGEAQAAMRALGETVRVVGDAFRLVLNTAVRELGPVIVELAPFAQELATVIGEKIANAIAFVAPLLRDFARFLSENREVIAPLVSALLTLVTVFKVAKVAIAGFKIAKSVVDGFKSLATAIRNINPATLSRIATVLRRFIFPALAFAALLRLAEYINEVNIAAAGGDESKLEGFARNLNNIVGAVDLLGKALSGDTGPLLKAFRDDLDSFKSFSFGGEGSGGLDGSASRAIGNIVKQFAVDGALLKAKIDEIVGFVRDIPRRLTEGGAALDQWAADLVARAGLAWENFKTTTSTKLDEARTRIANFFTYETGVAIGEWAGTLITNAQNAWEGFKTTTATKLEEARVSIVEFFTVTVPNALLNLGPTLLTKATEAWESFKSGSSTKFGEIVTEVQGLPDRIGTALAALPGILLQKALDAWNGFFGQTTTGTGNAERETGTLPGRMGSGLAALPGILLDKANQAWQSFLDGMTRKIATVLADARALPGKVSDAIGNVGSLLVAKGDALIEGLLTGIKNAYQRALDFVRGIADGLAAAKGPLSYDRVVMIAPGLALMQGLQRGIDQGYAQVRARVRGIADGLAGELRFDGSGTSIAAARLAAFEAGNAARAQAQQARSGALGDMVTQLTGIAQQDAHVTVNVLLSREQIAEIARVEIDGNNRQVARAVGAGVGTSF